MSAKPTKYPANPLSAIENGCLLDLRAKLAIEFLKTSDLVADLGVTPRDAAVRTLDIAEALLEEAYTRDLVHVLPPNGEISEAVKFHIERSIRAQIYQNTAGQKIARSEGPIVTGMGMGIPQ